ncbi:hypothetical protein GGTG_02278 [Gaeumannomyces tritici R3-111a-1]|uniref:Uncharacterized protein n=1 Tax=Gaeumannomyces tritici (strain R3-111a-1) TaxID=644352 RepID=J3NLX3_GAET3|nr:hypothetical protein GGTG_02278 [Gaeumannomyces tritici R3-111a-1]EJT82304.1 hypothetical protein GGTG_02278 [Gaeumannomyces tritici R3-111a-1]
MVACVSSTHQVSDHPQAQPTIASTTARRPTPHSSSTVITTRALSPTPPLPPPPLQHRLHRCHSPIVLPIRPRDLGALTSTKPQPTIDDLQSMASPTEGKRRFAPIPIETTFAQYRKPGNLPGPAAELTPDPSPEPSPTFAPAPVLVFEPAAAEAYTTASYDAPRDKRRFAPQLIDSSRRSRRTGDVGPATRPIDKTDITPYHNHIYSVQRTKKRHNKITGLARRESCDEETAEHMYNLAKKEIEKRLQEIALSAFPNSGQRIGGAEHFFAREGSDDGDDASEDADPRGRPQVRLLGAPRPRRDSTDGDISWHVKEAQDAVGRRARSRMDTRELDEMQLDSPPTDTMWLTSSRKETPSPQPFQQRERGPIGETHMPLISQSPLAPIGESTMPLVPSSPPPIKPIGEFVMPFIPSAPPGKAADMPFIPAETGFSRHAPARPFGFGGGFRRPAEPDRNLEALRKRSPPMLGADLTFRKCPSPKHTKLEPEHLWQSEADETNRDPTGQRGLWRGYCFTAESGEALAEIPRMEMISTPSIPSSSATDPFSIAFGTTATSISPPLSEEPGQLEAAQKSPSGTHSAGPLASLHAHKRSGEAKGLHMLMGFEERLRKEKAAVDLEEQIQAEFNDRYVTQVYNYLSLGYPAMARSYDDELSKISRIPLADLQRDDDALMDGVVAVACGGKAKGHIKLTEDDDTKEQDRCPRWKALKLYIHEWASQHPDLETISPLAWGVKERRGSWGI